MMERPRPVHETFSRWLLGLLLWFSLVGFFGAFNAAQLTSEGTGQRILSRAVAALIDIDAILPKTEQDLHAAAAESNAATVQVPNYPIDVQLPRQQALTITGEDLRRVLLDTSASRAYDDGLGVLSASDPEAQRHISAFSSEGAIDKGLHQITGSIHTFWLIVTIVLGLPSLLALVGFMRASPALSPAFVLAGFLLAAAAPSLLAILGMRLAFSQGDSDPFVASLLAVGKDALWVPARNYIAICGLAIGIVVLTVAVNFANREPPREQAIAG